MDHFPNANNIPSEAYLYFPPKHEMKNEGSRAIFDGNIEFEKSEIQHITSFKAYAQKHHYSLGPMWTDNMILRFLQANGFKNEKTLHSIQEHTTWSETMLPITLNDKIREFLNSGFLYVHGRDHKFRPIVVFNINLIDPKTVDFDVVTKALTFGLEYIINELMLPGQVENWIFISNVKGMGLASLAVQNVRKLFAYLQDHYKCRLYRMYLINASSTIYIPWSIIKTFLDGDTVSKVQFYKTQVPSNLFKHTHTSQIEEKYGGTATNTSGSWPPIMPSKDFFVSVEDAKHMISKEEYSSLYLSDALTGMKINPTLIAGQNEQSSTANSLTPSGFSSKEIVQEQKIVQIIELEDEETDYLDYMSEDMPTKDLGMSADLRGSFTTTPRANFTPRSSFTPRAVFN